MWEAWALALDHPEWADAVRSELEFLGPDSARDLLLYRLGQGPRLYGRWQQLREELRPPQLESARASQLLAEGLELLTPPADFVRHWADVQQYSGHYRSRACHVKVDHGLLRSPQPRLSALLHLKDTYGLTGLVNLREESEESAAMCQEAGIGYHWIPVPDMAVPSVDQVHYFLRLVRTGVHLVHCWAGQGRTGLFVACYRLLLGYSVDEAIARTDREIYSRGMRPGQRDWVRAFTLPATGRGEETPSAPA